MNEHLLVTITQEEYDKLQDSQLLLDCLRNNGVDNWCGWDEARQEYNYVKGEDE